MGMCHDEEAIAGVEPQRVSQVGGQTQMALPGHGFPPVGVGCRDHGTQRHHQFEGKSWPPLQNPQRRAVREAATTVDRSDRVVGRRLAHRLAQARQRQPARSLVMPFPHSGCHPGLAQPAGRAHGGHDVHCGRRASHSDRGDGVSLRPIDRSEAGGWNPPGCLGGRIGLGARPLPRNPPWPLTYDQSPGWRRLTAIFRLGPPDPGW